MHLLNPGLGVRYRESQETQHQEGCDMIFWLEDGGKCMARNAGGLCKLQVTPPQLPGSIEMVPSPTNAKN
jgi:hypothetical protein